MSALRLRLLGPPELSQGNRRPLTIRARKEQALLAYLAVERAQAHTRDTLVGLFWPEVAEAAARNSLRVALANLRQVLVDASSIVLITDRLSVELVAQDNDWLDVAMFRARIESSRQHAHVQFDLCDQCITGLREAIELYRGDFLSGLALPECFVFEEWVAVQREALHAQALSVLETLAASAEQRGDYAAVSSAARRQLALEPWRESAHRQVMHSLAASGDRVAALLQYEACRQILANELGIEPDVETVVLAERIRSGDLTPGMPAVHPNNLPAQPTPFVGREHEVAQIIADLQQPGVRLVTLVGFGGMGKTRLALELARSNLNAFDGGVFFVALASISTPEALVPTIATALGMTLQGDPTTALLRWLRDRCLLLILDNVEHLLDLDARDDVVASGGPHIVALLVAIIEAAPRVQIIATSRERLNMRGEQVYPVEGLPYNGPTAAAHAATSAVRMFAQSAHRVQPTFQLSDANLPAVVHICRLTQGMPLALELAAAWTDTMALPDIATAIESSVDFLETARRDMPERQRSIRAVFDWSWRLLTNAERRVFMQLAVFRGGFTLEAAEAVVGGSRQVLRRLVHTSLLHVRSSPTEPARYEVHELLRQFAAEQLRQLPELDAAVAATHSHFYLVYVAERTRRFFRDEPGQAATEIQREFGNIRVAWWWAVHAEQFDALVDSAGTLWQYCRMAGLTSEWQQLLGAAIARTRSQATRDDTTGRNHSRLLALFGSLCIHMGLHRQALAAADEAIVLGQTSQGSIGEICGYLVKGQALRRLGKSEHAHDLLERAATQAQAYQHDGVQAELLADTQYLAYNWLCSIALTSDDYVAASGYVEKGLELCRRMGKRIGEIALLTDLVDIAIATGDYPTAERHGEAALAMAHRLGYAWGGATVHLQLNELARLRGDHARAWELISPVLERIEIHGDMFMAATAMGAMVRLGMYVGDYPAARMWFTRLRALVDGAETAAYETLQSWLIGAELTLAVNDGQEALRQAEQSYLLAQQLHGRASQAAALLLLGAALTMTDRTEDAAAAYVRALNFYTEAGLAHKASEARAGLARIALARGSSADAMTQVELILPILAIRQQMEFALPFSVYLVCYQALAIHQDPRAGLMLQQARQVLHTYAARIVDGSARQSFLECVASNRMLLSEF